jgi:hypothetical protein
MERLWAHLARWQPFPNCSGAGFSTSSPTYDPFYCDDGYRLVARKGKNAPDEVGCLSVTRQEVSAESCQGDVGNNTSGGGSGFAWEHKGDQQICTAFLSKPPNIRSKPRYIDITIDGSGTQRIWF